MADGVHSDLLLLSPIPVLILTPSMEVELVNDAFLQLSGYERGEVAGRTPPFPWWGDGPEDLPVLTAAEIEPLYKKGIKRLEKRYVRKDGSTFWAELSVSPIAGVSGVKYYLVSMVDVTNHRDREQMAEQMGLKVRDEALEQAYAALQQELAERTEWELRLEREVRRRTEELERSKEFWEQLFQQSPEGIVFLDGEDRVLQANRTFCGMFGYDPGEIAGAPINGLVSRAPGIQIDAERMTRRLYSGESFVYDTYRTKKDGTVLPVSLHASPFKFRGESFAYCGYRDISDRKKNEDRIKYHSSLQNLLARVSYRFVLPSDDVDSLVLQSLEDFGRFFGACFCRLAQFGPDGGTVRSMGWHLSPPEPELKDLMDTLSVEDIPWIWSRLDQDDVVMLDGLKSLPESAVVERRIFACSHGDRFMLYPLFLRGALSGMIVIGKKLVEQERADGMSNFYVFSSIISAALERHESKQTLVANYDTIRRTFESSIKTMGEMLAARDPYTARHQRNVSVLADLIAMRLGMADDVREGLRIASLVHDLGKIRIPAEILNKPGTLSSLEFDLIREHPAIGSEILSNIQFPWPVSVIVAQHHERMNGSGYPCGLLGDEILPQARVLAVADVVEAMTSHRPYRAGLGLPAALEEIKNGRGILYDSPAVDACLDLLGNRNDLDFLCP